MTPISTTTAVQQPGPALRRRPLRWLLAFAGGVLALLIIAAVALFLRMSYVPSNLDYSTTRMSEQSRYKVGYTSDLGSVPVNQMQSWTLHVASPDGQPVENAIISVDGDMPQHGHGLPTRPQVTRYLGNGDYRVEGLKFHMPGWWVMDFVVTADGQTDQVHFNLLLQ